MEKFKKIFEKYRVYLTRPRIEIATVLLIAICAVSVFLLNTPKKGVLTLDNGALVYDGTLVRGKMNGQGTMTFENGDQYTGSLLVMRLISKPEKKTLSCLEFDN